MAESGVDDFVKVQPDGAGKSIDTIIVTTGAGSVHRQVVQAIPAPGNHTYGEDLAVVAVTTVTLVSFVAPAGWCFLGLIGGGETDGVFKVKFGGTVKYVVRTNIANRHCSFTLSQGDSTAGGTTVTVEVTNSGGSTAAFEATLLGI